MSDNQITDVKIYDLRVPTSDQLMGSDPFHVKPDYSAVLTIIESSVGKKGLSIVFTVGAGNDWIAYGINQLIPLIQKLDIDSFKENPGKLYQTMLNHHQLRWLGDGVYRMAMGGLLNAIWDLWAKDEEKPLWKLLIELSPDKIINCIDWRHLEDSLSKKEAYDILEKNRLNKDNSEKKLLEYGLSAYSTAGWLGLSDNQILEKINQLRNEGFNAFKLKVGQDIDFDISRIQYIRENVDPDTLIMLDANQFWGVNEAITYMQKLARFNITWIEEPTNRDDILGFIKISEELNKLGVQVAAGEHIQSPNIFKQMLSTRAIQYAQIDASRLGGVNDIMAIILIAAKYNIPICPHGGGLGLCNMIRHFAIWDQISVAGHSNNQLVEYVDFLQDGVFIDPVKISKGSYVLPKTLGWGLEMHNEFIQKHLFPDGPIWSNRLKKSGVTFLGD